MSVYYEWDIEEIDEHGDIIDHFFADKLSDVSWLYKRGPLDEDDAVEYSLVLVRYHEDFDRDIEDRDWAYVKDGKLSEFFPYGAKVPVRFHRELESEMTQ